MIVDKIKEPTSNWERRLLAIIDAQKKDISFGSIAVEIKITNDRVTVVELRGITKTFKMDKDLTDI